MTANYQDFNLDDPVELELAKLWTVAMLHNIRNGGIWLVPRSRSIYIVDHLHRILLKVGGADEPAIERVAKAIGWTVEHHNPEENIL